MGIKILFPNIIKINASNKLILSNYEDENIVNIDGLDYYLSNLIIAGKVIYGGGNSYILNMNSPNSDELNDDDIPVESVLKICKYPVDSYFDEDRRRIERFVVEKDALYASLKENSVNVIKIITDGTVTISKEIYRRGNIETIENKYLFYVMESAEYNLPLFLKMYRLSIHDKLDLCSSIINGLSELHDKGYYHRDIKHENILFVKGVWKIGDLGLAGNQDPDKQLDIKNEKIGPYGWLSPEVMNKVLTEGKGHITPPFDCLIDQFSDYFQLGKLVWYIFQENIPIGTLRIEDFRINDDELFNFIITLLQHNKTRRPQSIENINSTLNPIIKKYLLSA
jgi:serine/threonine protein kinase